MNGRSSSTRQVSFWMVVDFGFEERNPWMQGVQADADWSKRPYSVEARISSGAKAKKESRPRLRAGFAAESA